MDETPYRVVPSKPVCPASLFLANGRKFCPTIWVVLLRTAAEDESLLRHAAKHAFFSLKRPQLEQLATDEGLKGPWGSLVDLVLALVRKVLKPSAEDEEAIMALRGTSPASDLPAALTPEIMAEVAGKDAAKDLEDQGRCGKCKSLRSKRYRVWNQ